MKVRSLSSNKPANWLGDSSGDESEEPVLFMNNVDNSITAMINERKTKLIVDTGSKYDITSSHLHKTLFKNCKLKETRRCFTAYEQTVNL